MDPTVTVGERLLRTWAWEPSVLLGLLALGTCYLVLVRPARSALPFLAGLLTLFLALVSPLDALADRYLFSAHMLQHLLLTLVAPPLLLLGTPGRLLRRLLGRPARARPPAVDADTQYRRVQHLGYLGYLGYLGPLAWLERRLGQPLVALVLYTAVVTGWHLPALYEWALRSVPAHVAEHLMLLAAATLFWWPVVHPRLASAHLDPLARIGYLFAACVPGSVLGAVLTFAPTPFYPTYASADDPLGLLPLTRGAWGLTPLADQQLGGLLMWLPGGLVYLVAIGIVFVRWFAAADADDGRLAAGPAPAAAIGPAGSGSAAAPVAQVDAVRGHGAGNATSDPPAATNLAPGTGRPPIIGDGERERLAAALEQAR